MSLFVVFFLNSEKYGYPKLYIFVNVSIVILQRKKTTETVPAPSHKKDKKEDKQS